MNNDDRLEKRVSPLAMSSEEFRKLGTELIDRIGDFLESLPSRPVTPAESPAEIRHALGSQRTLPQQGADPGNCSIMPLTCSSITPCSMGILDSGDTSRHRLHPSARSVNCWLLRSTPTLARGCFRRWLARLKGRRFAGLPRCWVIPRNAEVFLSAVAIWRTLFAFLLRGRRRRDGMCAPKE